MSKAVLSGVVAGLIGAAIWGGITYATGVEIGWIAWGVGGLVGLAVRLGASGDEGATHGFIAAVIALASIVAGKFLAVYLFVASLPPFDIPTSPQNMIVGYALDICDERAAKGKPVRFAPGMDAGKASKAEDFPKDVWQEASKQWDKLGADGQQAEIKKRQEIMRQASQFLQGELRTRGFWASFSAFDLLWGFLAVATAFRLASGLVVNED